MEKENTQAEPVKPAKRLCSEIQLFDLCERERCAFKDGRFCTDPALLARFEQLPDEDDEQGPEPSGRKRHIGDRDDEEMLYGDEDDFEELDDDFDPEEDEWQD